MKFYRNFIKIGEKINENCLKITIFQKIQNSRKNAKKFYEILLRFSLSTGAKECQSCRSRKMLKNAYLDAKIGFDTAENEPSEVRGFLIGVRGVMTFPTPPLIYLDPRRRTLQFTIESQ